MAFLAGAAGGATVSIVVNAVDKFSRVFTSAQMQMKGLTGTIAKHQGAFLAAGAAITGIGIATGFAMSKMVKQAISFEDAFIGVKKTVELSEEEFKKLEKRFKDMAKTIPMTFEELSKIGEIAGQLGVTGVDNLAEFTKTIAAISVTTNMTAEQAATDFARIANVMGVPINEVDRMGSAIVDLGNNFATTEGEIVAMTMRIMGAGKTVGMNTQEVFGMSAALSALGIRSEMGGSAISRAMITIAKSVATGSDELASFAEVSGMSIDEFSAAWKDKPVEALSKVIIGLKGITESGGNTFGILEELDMKSIRITDTMLRLAGSQDGITKAVNMSKTAWEENMALTDEANKRYASMKSQLIILGNRFKILAAELGVILFPMLEKIIGAVTKLTDWFSNLSDGQKKFIVIAGVVATALALVIGPLLIMLALLPAITAGIAMVTAISLPMIGTFLIVAGVIAAVIAIGWLLVKHWDKVKEAGTKMGMGLKNVFIGIHNVVASVWNGIINIIEKSINKILGAVNSLIRLMNRIPGVNFRTIGGVDFGRYKAEMMDYAKLGSFKTGGIVPKTGLYELHKGENVIPTSETNGVSVNNYYNFENINGLSGRDIAESLQEELNKKI